ncbi:hypothetical protein J1614_002323 [Plenodomus biglobosus]|nr:hypothetical protein J1614_002323 [Plenodomus biglobosus]
MDHWCSWIAARRFTVFIPSDHWDWQDKVWATTLPHHSVLCYFQCYTNQSQLSQQDTSRPQSINCRHCDHLLGHPDAATSGWRLEKWNLGIRSPIFFAAGLPVSYSAQKWISARFLSLIENTGIRKFNVHPPLPPSSTTTPSSIKTNTDNPPIYQQPPITPSINLWLFTPDLLFSSSLPSPARKDPTRAMKIFYKNTTHAPLQPGQPEPAGTEDVEFPPDLYEELDAALRLSGRVLPVTARRWGEWGVGVLERFDGAEVLGVGRGRGGGTGLEEGGLESEDVD